MADMGSRTTVVKTKKPMGKKIPTSSDSTTVATARRHTQVVRQANNQHTHAEAQHTRHTTHL